MKHPLTAVLLIASFGIAGGVVQAQERWRGEYPPERVSAVIHRVHEDLNRGYGSGWHFNHHDSDRLTHAEHQLRDFAQDWRRGKFDKGDLDDAIGAIQHVVDNNHMSGPERDALWRDLDALRHMREAYDRHEIGRW